MKCDARFLGTRFATPQVTLGRNGRGAAVGGAATVMLEWEVRVDAVQNSSWGVYYRFVTSQGGEEMGLVQADCCNGASGDRAVRLFLPSPGKQYEYRVVWDGAEDGASGTNWQALPDRAATSV